MKKGWKAGIALAVVLAAAGGVAYGFRGKLLGAKADPASDPPAFTTVKVARGDLTLTVSASGQFEPNTITTIRPDANMPTRKIVKILVKEGDRVKTGQVLAEIDATGLDLNVKSAEAAFAGQKVKLDNLKGKPVDMDRATAESDLVAARTAAETQGDAYASTKSLADKGFASGNALADAQRQLDAAKAKLRAAELAWQNAKAQNIDDTIKAQEAAVSQADYDHQMARLILDSAFIRSPVNGVVAEVLVNVGDLLSPSTAIMTVVDTDPMLLQAQVNENDMANVKAGNTATVTPSGYPDWRFAGKVTQINLHAAVVNNVSVFTVTVELANPEGKLLWGMNADAEITVLSLADVLTVPTSAVKTVNGTSQVAIIDEGKPVSWDVQTGPSDGSKTQVVAGLDEGQEIVLANRRASQGQARTGGAPGGLNAMFRVMH